MTQYEEILSKITSILYKFSNYRTNLTVTAYTILDYLKNFRVPQKITVKLPITYVNYIYAIKYIDFTSPLSGKTSSDHIIWLTKKDNISWFNVIIDEFIVNMVINKFNFEKSYITSGYTVYSRSYKDLFIALVGKDTYDTIRKYIK